MVDIQVEMPGDGPAIEQLLDLSFGPGREHRPSYRLREGVAPDAALGLTARDGSQLVGTIRFWPALIAGRVPVLLLDEITAHLDARRRAALFEAIEDLGAQAWLTGTDEALFAPIRQSVQFYSVANGRILKQVTHG